MNELIKQVSDASFEDDVIRSGKPVLVDFWATWCEPCVVSAPILEEISQEFADRIRVAKIDVDQHHATAARFGVRAIPTVVLFKDGAIKAQQVGVVSKTELGRFIERHLK
ncbi:thioredoxin [Caballeronia insecticola]|nr:thioredoxin [Caballeronia insecticola]